MSDDATATETATTPAPPRYDILVVSQNRAFNMVEQGLKSLVNVMQASGYFRVTDESLAEEWSEIYAGLGPSSHEMFVKGAYVGSTEVFHEIAIRGGTRPTVVPFGTAADETCYFWIEVRGALFPELTGKLKNKFKDLMMTRCDFFSRPHTGLPPHAVVPPDEAPSDKKKKKDGPAARVGTAVEEF